MINSDRHADVHSRPGLPHEALGRRQAAPVGSAGSAHCSTRRDNVRCARSAPWVVLQHTRAARGVCANAKCRQGAARIVLRGIKGWQHSAGRMLDAWNKLRAYWSGYTCSPKRRFETDRTWSHMCHGCGAFSQLSCGPHGVALVGWAASDEVRSARSQMVGSPGIVVLMVYHQHEWDSHTVPAVEKEEAPGCLGVGWRRKPWPVRRLDRDRYSKW